MMDDATRAIARELMESQFRDAEGVDFVLDWPEDERDRGWYGDIYARDAYRLATLLKAILGGDPG